MVIVRREMIDAARRYNPQPIPLESLVRNVRMERTLLIKLTTNRIIVNAELHFTTLV
jgi:hypothetical protein